MWSNVYIAPTLAVTALPGVRSYYGVDMMTGGGRTWVADRYDGRFYDRPDSLRDPLNDPGFDVHQSSLRGNHIAQERWQEDGLMDGPVPRRQFETSNSIAPDLLIRCVRSVPMGM